MREKTRGLNREANFSGQPATTWGTQVTANSTVHTLSDTFTELIASTAYTTSWVNILIHSTGQAATQQDILINIYVGADGSEQLVIPYLTGGWSPQMINGSNFKRYSFPLSIPQGSRLSMKAQSDTSSKTAYVMVDLLSGTHEAHWTGTGVEAVGVNTGTSVGTSVTAGTTSDGTLTSIGTNTYEWGYCLPTIGGNISDVSQSSGLQTIDLASSNSTANLLPGLGNFLVAMNSSEQVFNLEQGRFCTVPAGTTLYARGRTDATAEAKDYIIYGVH